MNDDLRKDLRSEFERQQTGLGDIRGFRETLVTRALEDRDERGDRLPAPAIAAIVITAIVIGTFAYIRSGIGVAHHGPPITASSPRLGSPAPPTPGASQKPVAETTRLASQGWIVDADMFDASTGWVLISNCISPMTGQCHYAIAQTTDGGQTWSNAVQVGPMFDPTTGDAPRHVHFINAKDGFVYGGARAYATHDSGRTWSSLSVTGSVVAIVTGLVQLAWVITYPCSKGVRCQFEVRMSTDAGRTWSSPHLLPLDFDPLDATAFGPSGLLISSQPTGDMELTLDGGATWTSMKTRCTANNLIVHTATADGNELWELCMDYPDVAGANVSHKVLFGSEDRGVTWSPRSSWQVSGPLVASGYSVVMAASGPGTVVMATFQSTIEVTQDGGRTWTDVGPPGIGIMDIQFGNANDGWALDAFQYIWATHDGGASWNQLPTGLLQVMP